MTRQENIATLSEHLDHWKRLLSEKICDQDEGEKTIDALQNAIKALEQQPIVVMGDMMPHKCHRAEWIKTYTYYNEGWKCSNCGNFSHIRLRTCPNCLAEMEVQNDK